MALQKTGYIRNRPLLTDLQAFYSFEDGQDDWKFSKDLGNINGVTFVPGLVGDAASFDVNSAQYLIGQSSTIQPNQDFYGACWVFPLASIFPTYPIHAQINFLGQYNFVVALLPSLQLIRLFLNNGTQTVQLSTGNPLNAWHFIEYGYIASTEFFFVGFNRVEQFGSSVTGINPIVTPLTFIGRQFSNYFNGLIDQLYFRVGSLPTTAERDFL